MRCKAIITGTKPLLMHQDNLDWGDEMLAWRKDAANKKRSVAGDDRSPAWSWLGYLYHDGKYITLPSDNGMTMLREGGAGVPVPGAKGSKTFKAQTQSGIIPLEPDWEFFGADGKRIPVAPILALKGVEDFEEHLRVVRELGFDLLVKRARVGQSKHVRVRPIFRAWSAQGTLEIVDDQITPEILQVILDVAGTYKGLCDWRPSSKTPGCFGTFTGTVEVL